MNTINGSASGRFQVARVVNEQTAEHREQARRDAVAAIRALENRLVSSLAGELLRGLPNLCPESTKPFYAMRLRCKDVSDVLPHDGRAVLVLCNDGVMRMARREVDTTLRPMVLVNYWDAEDSDIMAEDLQCVVKRTYEALDNHVARTTKASARYAAVSDLASRLTAVLRR